MPRDDASPDSETPWTEAQWETFLKEGELRAARYGELLESLMDHPDRDAIIDREMGWNRRAADSGEDDDELALLEDTPEDDDQIDDQIDDQDEYDSQEHDVTADDTLSPPPWLSMEEEHADADEDLSFVAEDAALSTIDAYARSKAIAVRIHEALKPALESQDQHTDEEFAEAFINSQIACVKIASGHGMG